MASTLNFLLITIFFSLIIVQQSHTERAPFKPNSLVLPIQKDPTTNLYITNILKRTPQVSIPLLLDLNGMFLWVTCDQNYLSSTYNAPFCHSTQCSRAGVFHYCHKCPATTARPGCHNQTCGVIATNPVTRKNGIGEIAEDVVSVPSVNNRGFDTNGTGPNATIPRFLFACANSSLLQGRGFPQNIQGVAGLGHTPISLPIQLASRLGFDPQFSLCLPTSNKSNGGVFFGEIPSFIQTTGMSHTPLTVGPQGEYFILVRAIRINNQTVPFNTSLLSSTRGFGGTMISTTTPFTTLEHSVFTTFTQFFGDQMKGVPQVKAIPPFGMCFNASMLPPTRVGTPNIDFVMQNRNITWTILGVDALVRMQNNVSCLGVVDGGKNARASITIGANMLEDRLFQFDLLRSSFGFFPSRLARSVDCSSFNITGGGDLELDHMLGKVS